MNEDTREEKIEVKKKGFPHNYKILDARNQMIDGEARWSTEWLLSEYVSLTDGLIGKMDGSIPMQNRMVYVPSPEGMVQERRDLPPPGAIIYLDKSARPVAWLVRGLWPVLAQKEEHEEAETPVPRPKEFFLNIDKMDWLRKMGVPPEHLEDPPEELVDFSKITREDLSRIRAMYSMRAIEEANLEEVWDHPTRLDGMHVMIVDEVRSSGQTLQIAQRLLSMAIPEAIFSGEYWATPTKVALNAGAQVNGRSQFKVEWVPLWYNAKVASGRGIGDRDPRWPEIVESMRATPDNYTRLPMSSRWSALGREILSTPPHDPQSFTLVKDAMGNNLRKDVARVAEDLSKHRILYRPSPDRLSDSDEDFDALVKRIKKITGLDYDEWMSQRDNIKPKPRR